MWQVNMHPSLQEFWKGTDLFVKDFLEYALLLQGQNLSDSDLDCKIAEATGKLDAVITGTVKKYLVRFVRCPDLEVTVRGFQQVQTAYRQYLTYPQQPLLTLTTRRSTISYRSLTTLF